MALIEKIHSVNRIYRQLAIHNSYFKKASGIGCPPGCSACCINPEINATILEFLPAAYDLCLKGAYEPVLTAIDERGDSGCIFYNPMNEGGACSNYQNRGLICRLFGSSSKLDKYENRVLVSCKIIKSNTDPLILSNTIIKSPDMNAYYMKLFGIDQKLSIQYFPINEAIKKAIEIVLLHFQYRKKPA